MSIKKEPRKFNCVICGIEGITRDKRSKLCKSPECAKKFSVIKYNSTFIEKFCVVCSNKFKGKFKETVCGDSCFKEAYRIGAEKLEKTEVNWTCRHCGVILKTETKSVNWKFNPETRKRKLTCDACRIVVNEGLSNARKGNKNPNWKEIKKPSWKDVTPEQKIQNKQRTSDRMRASNPMHNLEVRSKVANTRKCNSLVYKQGKEHHLWKGTSDRKHTIRSRLYRAWTYPILFRDGFKCTTCGKSGNRKLKIKLEVHHERPFRDILKSCVAKYNKPLKNLTDEEFERLSTEVIENHKIEEGKTHCGKCHGEIDEQRAQFLPKIPLTSPPPFSSLSPIL